MCMSRFFKYTLRLFLTFVVGMVVYLLTAFICVNIKVNHPIVSENKNTIYLTTNGVHLDVVIPVSLLTPSVKEGLALVQNDKYVAFGWGDADFYLNTPTWSDLTFKTAVKALFLKSDTLIHITRLQNYEKDWVGVPINTIQLKKINAYLEDSFQLGFQNQKLLIPNASYFNNDSFYKANGSYSVLKTCNTWVNQGFKYSGLPSCYWTPFDFGLLRIYE